MDGILLVDKPAGMTSHDVINRLRRILGMRKIGHTGTLDPQAEGLLMVMLGNCTKLLPYILNNKKEYVAKLQIGLSSDTEDIWGTRTQYDEKMPKQACWQAAMSTFLGEQQQIPPMVSAIKINGKKLYEYARANQTIERPSRTIHIYELELLSQDESSLGFRCVCSAGTYIRTLCVDLGKACGVHAVMSSLIRQKMDNWDRKQAYTLEQIEAGQFTLIHPYALLQTMYPMVSYESESDIRNGRAIRLPNQEDELVMITDPSHTQVWAAYQRQEDGSYRCKRGLFV